MKKETAETEMDKAVLEAIKRIIETSGTKSDPYSGHSFRRGGASWAYQSGVSVETIRQIGDWRSNAYTRYIFDSPVSLENSVKLMYNKLPT